MSGCPSFLTEAIYQSLAPSPSSIYTYANFCTAIGTWNGITANTKIFYGATDLAKKNEVAAFLGHVLHESGDLVYPREISQCGTFSNGYCQSSNTGGYSNYCSASHTTSTDPNGCNCGTVAYSSGGGGYEANKMFFGRGPIQLSWNYNYIDAGAALGVDLCTSPDLVATDGSIAWGTAIWFWMVNTGSTGITPHTAVTGAVPSFGGSLNTINGGLECTTGTTYRTSIVSRLDDYCRAVNTLGAELLSFYGCTDLQTVYNDCISASPTWGTCASCKVTAVPTASPSSPTSPPTTSRPTTSKPTAAPASVTYLWVPDWQVSNAGCVQSPSNVETYTPKYNDQSTCCSTHYNWNYVTCMGGSGTANTLTGWYPNWLNGVNECLNDGNQPTYMNTNPVQYLSPTREACCAEYYSWSPSTCLGVVSGGTPTGWYPNWLNGVNECLNDGNQPTYMNTNPAQYLSPTREECCAENYSWSPSTCLGVVSGGTSTGWYPNWLNGVNECLNDGNQPAYMNTNPDQYLSTTREACCAEYYSWSPSTCLGVVSGGTSTSLWYLDWSSGGRCVQDCAITNGGSCGGPADPWEHLWGSKSECCAEKLWDTSCMSN